MHGRKHHDRRTDHRRLRTPRGIGKSGKGALSEIHPQQLGSTVLRALAERNGINTAEVDDVIWGTSSQRGPQSGDLGRMSALDAGYDMRASGVTLDRFCGSGITAVNFAASIMSGMADLVVAGGTEMMSMHRGRAPSEGRRCVDTGNLRLRAMHPQTHQGVCADAIATLEGITRAGRRCAGPGEPAPGGRAITGGIRQEPGSGLQRGRHGSRSTARNSRARRPPLEGLAGLKPVFRGPGRRPAGRRGLDLPQPDPQNIRT